MSTCRIDVFRHLGNQLTALRYGRAGREFSAHAGRYMPGTVRFRSAARKQGRNLVSPQGLTRSTCRWPVVVTAIDRLGRSVAEVTRTITELNERRILLRAIREGIDTNTPTGRAVAAIMAILAELELELGKERRAASRQSRRGPESAGHQTSQAQPRSPRTTTPARCHRRTGQRTRRRLRGRASHRIPLSRGGRIVFACLLPILGYGNEH